MSVNPWIELPPNEPGLYQLAGKPVSNYNLLLYGKALLTRREGSTVFFIDNHGSLDFEKLKSDLGNDTELINGFFVFSPKSLQELFTIVDDLDMLYFHTATKPVIFISGMFEFLIRSPTNSKHLGLMAYILGLLREFNVPVFVTNEMRASGDIDLPFLSFYIPTFFLKVYIIEIHGKEPEILEYNF